MKKTRMPFSVFCVMSVLAVSLGGQQRIFAAATHSETQWDETKEGLQLSVRTSKPVYGAGEMVLLKIIIRNTSDIPRGLIEYNPETDFRVTLTDAQGKAVPLTRWGQALPPAPSPAPVSVFSRPLVHGSDVTHQLILSRRFDLSELGRYSVMVIRPGIPKQDHSGSYSLSSNTYSFDIVEPRAEISRPENFISR